MNTYVYQAVDQVGTFNTYVYQAVGPSRNIHNTYAYQAVDQVGTFIIPMLTKLLTK